MPQKTLYKVEDLATLPPLPEGQHYELSEGELIIGGNARFRHEDIKARVAELLTEWNLRSRQGRVYSELMYKLGEGTARQPDVSFVTSDRRAAADLDLQATFVPNLAVEVLSESESITEAEAKVHQYLDAGVSEVWQLFPDQRLIHVRTPGQIRELTATDTLTTPVLPGFETSVSRMFE
jgi:Uma2 family endonuclease